MRVLIPLDALHVAPENRKVYRPITDDDPAIALLAKSIRCHGVKEPLVISQDRFILSGHRRAAAARLAGLSEVPCRIEAISRKKEPDRFLTLLTEFNRQREKSLDEKVREAAIATNPDDAYTALVREREKRKHIAKSRMLDLGNRRVRAKITDAKEPFLRAILRILNEDLRDYLPVSLRQIHYNLLNHPPLMHAAKPDSVYWNDITCSKSLSELATRARIEGLIDEDAIDDDTRPIIEWNTYRNLRDFVDDQLARLFQGYWRDPLQSQRDHFELVVEKNTIANILEPVAREFGIRLLSGRGFSSLPPRIKMKNRFLRSGKERLIIILVSDFDPSGEWIPISFARDMRDDFGLEIVAVKAALKFEQVSRMKNLPESVDTEDKKIDENTHWKAFKEKYGEDQPWYELEALRPNVLQDIVRRTINGLIDRERFNAEVQRMKEEAPRLIAYRRVVIETLRNINFEDWD